MTAAAMNIQMVGSDETLLKNMVMDLKDRLPADENLTVVSIIGRQNTGIYVFCCSLSHNNIYIAFVYYDSNFLGYDIFRFIWLQRMN